MKQTTKAIVQKVIDELPYWMRIKAEKDFAAYLRSKREPLTVELVAKLYQRIIDESKNMPDVSSNK
ncbi:MAG: hypothetical protein KGL39_19760 [Patescibacteria group bacterium]|nr:hypothetical protein [Patescibacteria group bacterium]